MIDSSDPLCISRFVINLLILARSTDYSWVQFQATSTPNVCPLWLLIRRLYIHYFSLPYLVKMARQMVKKLSEWTEC